MTILAATVTPDSITMIFDGQTHVLTSASHPNYDGIRTALRTKDEDKIRSLLVLTAAYDNIASDVTIEHGIVKLGGVPMHNAITNRLLEQHAEGFDTGPMRAFLSNLQLNPSKQAVDELYLFIEKTDLPVTPDGCFIAYKWVSEDYKDLRTGTFDNSVGGPPVTMPRNKVDDRRDVTCSDGLHLCSQAYLNAYGGGGTDRVVLVKVNPKDVVSIPNDYKNAKARVCEYLVVGEIDAKDATKEHSFGTSVMSGVATPNAGAGKTWTAPANVSDDAHGDHEQGDLVTKRAFGVRYGFDIDEVMDMLNWGDITSKMVDGKQMVVWEDWFDGEFGGNVDLGDLGLETVDNHGVVPGDASAGYALMTRGVAASSLGISRGALSKRLSRGTLEKEYVDGVEMIKVPNKRT